ncbi:MAG: hypothetical protein RLY49_343 [Candidatus Parcubacteria bacterium]
MNTKNPTNIFTRILILIFLGFTGISRWRHSIQERDRKRQLQQCAQSELFSKIERGFRRLSYDLPYYFTTHFPVAEITFKTRMEPVVIHQALLAVLSGNELLIREKVEEFKQFYNRSKFVLPAKFKGFSFCVEVLHHDLQEGGKTLHCFIVKVEAQ